MSGIQVSAAAGNKGNEKVTVIRMTAPPSFQPAPVQKTAVVKVQELVYTLQSLPAAHRHRL